MNENDNWWMRTAARNISQTTAEADRQRDWRRSRGKKWLPLWAMTFVVLSSVGLWVIVGWLVYVIVRG